MKKIIVALLFILFVNFANAESVKEKNEKIIIKAFETSKSDFTSFNVNYSSNLNDDFLSIDKLGEKADEFIHSMGIKERYREVSEESNMSKISIYGQVANENTTLILYSYLDKKDEKGETTIFIDINENEDYKNIEEIRRIVSETLEKQKIKPKITSCIIGSYEGQLKGEHKMEIVKKLTSLTDARVIENIANNELISYSLYSKHIDNYIYSGTNKINLNIAIRYDEYRDRTNIFIASPIITTGY